MKCNKCGNEILDENDFCPKCGIKIKKEKNLKKNCRKNIIIISFIIIILIIIAILIFLKFNKNNIFGFKTNSTNIYDNQESISFSNMNADDENLTEIQKEILKYFDNGYLFCDIANLQKYSQIFEKAKIATTGGVVKVLKSTNDEFEALVFEDEFGYYFGEYPTDQYSLDESNWRLYIVKGAQLNERLVENDFINTYGRYEGVETREINGNTYILPVINAINVNRFGEDTYSIETIRTVANHIFGKNIKITQPEDTIETNYLEDLFWRDLSEDYLVTLDNQSNANFKAFNMSKTSGEITYNETNKDLYASVIKRLFISSDFQHFIVTTYDINLKYVYIDYFDKDLNKLWAREFAYNSNDLNNLSPMDYNSTQMSIVIDNDLYLINTETGKNIIEPVLVGSKTKILIMSDGIILIGKENKDLIMKVDFKGKILYRIDGDTKLTNIDSTQIQIVNGKLLICINGQDENALSEEDELIKKYMVITNDGKIEYSTKDLNAYNG